MTPRQPTGLTVDTTFEINSCQTNPSPINGTCPGVKDLDDDDDDDDAFVIAYAQIGHCKQFIPNTWHNSEKKIKKSH